MGNRSMIGRVAPWLACGLFCVTALQAQDIQKVLPQTLPVKPTTAPVKETKPVQATANGHEVIIKKLKGLVFVAGPKVKADGVSSKGIKADKLPILQQPEFQAKMQAYLNKPVTLDGLNQITRAVIDQYRQNDRPIVDAIIPEQDVTGNTLQVAVIEGRVNAVKVVGNRWFDSSILAGEVGLQRGDSISERELVENMNTMNQNPFHSTNIEFARGPEVGTTDVIAQTQDRFPVRFYAGYDNTGNLLTGLDRWNAGFNYGNLFGLDQQFNYQFTTSSDFDHFEAHAASYIIPLPWHHTLSFFGGYIDMEGNDQGIAVRGFAWQASTRYNIPLPTVGGYTQSVSGGYDFKETNTNIDTTAFDGNVTNELTDVSQFVVSYNSTLRDPTGLTSFSLTSFLSPGDMTGKNTTSKFEASQLGAHADYVYGQAAVTRTTQLPGDFTWLVRGIYQDSSSNLVGSEQFGLGGADTVRGYLEREANGSEGWLVSSEVRTPPVSLGGVFSDKFAKSPAHDQLQFLGFVDYGWTRNNDLLGGAPNTYLLSVGPGVRYTVGKYLSVKFDYGFQLTDPGLGDPAGSRGELAATLSY
jgi:hemolysin activation/secretion protein